MNMNCHSDSKDLISAWEKRNGLGKKEGKGERKEEGEEKSGGSLFFRNLRVTFSFLVSFTSEVNYSKNFITVSLILVLINVFTVTLE